MCERRFIIESYVLRPLPVFVSGDGGRGSATPSKTQKWEYAMIVGVKLLFEAHSAN
jgi:hypothetical protein